MAHGRQPPPGTDVDGPRGLGEVGRRHNWHDLHNYDQVALTRLENLLLSTFVGDIVIVHRMVPMQPWLRFSGHIGCRGRLIVTFDKYLEIHPRDRTVRVRAYTYNCHIQRRGNVLRYDNAHGRSYDDDDAENQRTTWHHRHEWAEPDPMEASGGVRTYIGDPGWAEGRRFPQNDWPHLDEVVQELEIWHAGNTQRLGLPDEFPDLATCPEPPLSTPRRR